MDSDLPDIIEVEPEPSTSSFQEEEESEKEEEKEAEEVEGEEGEEEEEETEEHVEDEENEEEISEVPIAFDPSTDCSAFLKDYLKSNPPPLNLKTLGLGTSKNGKIVELKYEKEDDDGVEPKKHSYIYHDGLEGCWIVDQNLLVQFPGDENAKALDVFKKDLDVIWSLLKPDSLETLKIELSNFEDRHLLEHIRGHLEARNFRIKKLKIGAFLEKQVMQILPLLDQYTLESIVLHKPTDLRYRGFEYKFYMEQMAKTWQFQNCKRIEMEEIYAHARLRLFLNFSRAKIRLAEVKGEDVVALKKAFFLPTSHGKEFEVTFQKFDHRENTFLHLFGPPTTHENGTKSWRKEVLKPTDILQVAMKPKWFSFYRA